MSIIPDFFLDCVVSIGIKEPNDKNHFIGSGFLMFVEKEPDNGYIFLVTNKHVLDNQTKVFLRFNKTDLTTSKDYHLDLFKDGKKYYSQHKDNDVDIAVVFLNINPVRKDGGTYASFVIKQHTQTLAQMMATGITEGTLTYTLGFPMNLVDTIKNPIVRMGCISRINDIFHNHSLKNFIIDCQTFPGNSGGPVINRPESLSIEGSPHNQSSNLIGIVHSYIPYQESVVSLQTGRVRTVFEENSGLTLVHPVDLILEVIKDEAINKKLPLEYFNF